MFCQRWLETRVRVRVRARTFGFGFVRIYVRVRLHGNEFVRVRSHGMEYVLAFINFFESGINDFFIKIFFLWVLQTLYTRFYIL